MLKFPSQVWAVAVLIGLVAVSLVSAEAAVRVETAADNAERFSGVELTIRTAASFDDPYDPEDIDVSLDVTSPARRRVSVPCFYYQDFEYRHEGSREWLYPRGMGEWKARFAPTEVGEYSAVAVVRNRAGTGRSDPVTFRSLTSSRKGFVHRSAADSRYLQYDDGTPFFVVGQNIAFVKDSQRTIDMIRKLGAAGGNFARVWACCEDWALALEARKSAWGRSWDWRPPIVIEPGPEGYQLNRQCVRISGDAGASVTCSPAEPVALKPDTRYQLSGRFWSETGAALSFDLANRHVLLTARGGRPQRFHEEFTTGADQRWLADLVFRLSSPGAVYLEDLSLKEAGGGPELLWEADVNRPILGSYNQTDAFLLDHVVRAAGESGVHLQIVLLTRNHYMPLLANEGSPEYRRAITYARRLLRYCVARWGYSTSVASWEYFNEIDPHLPTDPFYSELGKYLESIDINHHLRATSAWSAPDPHWHNPQLDTADLHYYLRPAGGEVWKDAVAAVRAQVAMMEKNAPGKPHLITEFGVTDNAWNRSPLIDSDKQMLHLHDGLWASIPSGCAGTVCYWYWDDMHARHMYRLYTPISRFVANIPWTAGDLRPVRSHTEPGLRVIGLQDARGAWFWVSAPQPTWWAVATGQVAPRKIEGASVSLEGVAAGEYRAEWWDTNSGEISDSDVVRTNGNGALLKVPPFTRDIACKLLPLRAPRQKP